MANVWAPYRDEADCRATIAQWQGDVDRVYTALYEHGQGPMANALHDAVAELSGAWETLGRATQPAQPDAAALLRDLLAASEAYERALRDVEFAGEECLTLEKYNTRVTALEQATDALHRAQDAARAAAGGA